MIFIDESIDQIPIDNIEYAHDNELCVTVPSSTLSTRTSYGVPFQPLITNFQQGSDEDPGIIVFPLIPQYFHNFFELFPKMIFLKQSNKNFKVIILFIEELENGIFPSLLRNHPNAIINAAHMKDFLDFAGIEYECVNIKDIHNIKSNKTYLFFSQVNGQPVDRTIRHDNNLFEIEHFLKVPHMGVLKRYVEQLRNFFPTTIVKKNKKIFISRKKAADRKWDKEDAVESLMVELGYEIVFLEDLALLEQIELLQSSQFIVCLYGSALVNCCLLSSNNNVLAINPTQNYEVEVYPEMMKLNQIPYTQVGAYNLDENYLEYLGYIIERWEKNEK